MDVNAMNLKLNLISLMAINGAETVADAASEIPASVNANGRGSNEV